MKGHRIFDRFGFDLPAANHEKVPARVTQDFEEWRYMPELRDWHSVDSEQMLVSCGLPADLVELLKQVDSEAE
jgi:hypothetical protein